MWAHPCITDIVNREQPSNTIEKWLVEAHSTKAGKRSGKLFHWLNTDYQALFMALFGDIFFQDR